MALKLTRADLDAIGARDKRARPEPAPKAPDTTSDDTLRAAIDALNLAAAALKEKQRPAPKVMVPRVVGYSIKFERNKENNHTKYVRTTPVFKGECECGTKPSGLVSTPDLDPKTGLLRGLDVVVTYEE